MHTLIPNASVLTKHLDKLAAACTATEVILFERTTFLVIATSSGSSPTSTSITTSSPRPATPPPPSSPTTLSSFGTHSRQSTLMPEHDGDDGDPHKLEPTRYERTSELIKAFKQTCTRNREEFHSLEMELADFTAVLDELTKNTYVLIVVHDTTIGQSLLSSPCLVCMACADVILDGGRDGRAEAQHPARAQKV